MQRTKKWFINGQRLEVVNSYMDLGYTLTTKLSVSTALEPITVKAQKKVTDILRSLWKIKRTDISIFLRLFDNRSSQHLPIRQKYGKQRNSTLYLLETGRKKKLQ